MNESIPHSLYGIPITEFQNFASQNANFKASMLGCLAEIALYNHLSSLPGVSSIKKISDFDLSLRGDFRISTSSGESFTVECKHPGSGTLKLTSTASSDKLDLSNTRLIPRGNWDILSVAKYHEQSDTWSFSFIPEICLPSSRKSDSFLKSSFKVKDLPKTESLTECIHVINTLTDLTISL